jgi:hypothetical protein
VLVPVSDYSEFLSGNPNVGEANTNGVSKVTVNGQILAVVKKMGNYAVFTKADNSVNFDVGKGLETAIETSEKTIAVGQPIWAYVNLQKVGEVYGDTAVAQLQKSKTMMADMNANMAAMLANLEKQKAGLNVNDPAQKTTIEQLDKQIASIKKSMKQFENNPMMGNMGNIMDMYIRIVETLLKESKTFSIAIEPKADILTISETYTALPGSELAKALVADTSTAKADKLVNYLHNGAMMNYACRLNKPLLQKFYSAAMDIVGIMAGGKMSDEEVSKMKEMTSEMIDTLGGAAAVSMRVNKTKTPLFMQNFIIEVSDADKFNKTALKGIEMWNNSGFIEFYKDMGIETNYTSQMNVYEYKGAKVNSALLTMKAADADSQQAQMTKKMYGDGIEYRWTVVDGLCVGTVGGDANTTIKQLIDKVKAGTATVAPSDIRLAMMMLGDGADDIFGTFNVIRMLKMVSAIQTFPIKDIAVESKSNIAFGGKINNGKFGLKVAVPKAHVKEVMSVFMPKPPAAK